MSRVYLPCPLQGKSHYRNEGLIISGTDSTLSQGCTTLLRHSQNLNQIVDHVADNHPEYYDSQARHIIVAPLLLKPSQQPMKPPILPLDPIATCNVQVELSAGPSLVRNILPFNIHHKSRCGAVVAAVNKQDPKDMVWGYINGLRVEDKVEKQRGGYILSSSLYLPPMPGHQVQLNDLPPRHIGIHQKPQGLAIHPTERWLSQPVPIPPSPLILEPLPCTIGYDVLAAVLQARTASPEPSEPLIPK